jgi:hypothetical protein
LSGIFPHLVRNILIDRRSALHRIYGWSPSGLLVAALVGLLELRLDEENVCLTGVTGTKS